MPNVSEKKLKLLYIAQLLLEKTDEDHAVTLPQMLEAKVIEQAKALGNLSEEDA